MYNSASPAQLRRTASDAVILAESSSQEDEYPCAQPRDYYSNPSFSPSPDSPSPDAHSHSPTPSQDFQTQATEIATQIASEEDDTIPDSEQNTLRNQNNKAWRRLRGNKPKEDPAPPFAPPRSTPVGDYYDLAPTQPLTPPCNSDIEYSDDEGATAAPEKVVDNVNPPPPSNDEDIKSASPSPVKPIVSPENTGSVTSKYKRRKIEPSVVTEALSVIESSADESEAPVPASSTKRKRKRGSRKTQPPSSKKRVHATKPPSTDQGSTPSSSTSNNSARILALWDKDNYYYPGTVVSQLAHSIYTIQFDDGNQSIVKAENLRLCSFRSGDVVSTPGLTKWQGGKVVTAAGPDPDCKVQVDVGEKNAYISVRDICIPATIVLSDWQDRLLSNETLPIPQQCQTGRPKRKASVRNKFASASRAAGLLEGTGFVLTLSDQVTKRTEIETSITSHGGVVLDDWFDIINYPTARESNKNRWILHQKAVQYTPKPDIQRFLLLGDVCSSKPKFLTALALGIPCVGLNILETWNVQSNNFDVAHYLLPQGMYKNTMVSQRIDLGWTDTGTVEGIIRNPVPPKIFTGKNILLFGQDIVLPTARGKQTTTVTPIPPILLAMGAECVETVRAVRHASKDLEDYDIVIAKDESDVKGKDGDIALWSWVKESLVLGREAPRS